MLTHIWEAEFHTRTYFFSSSVATLQSIKKNENVSQSCLLRPHELYPARFLCPWDIQGKNTGVGCHSLLQGIFLTQGSNPGLLNCRQILYHLSCQGGPLVKCSYEDVSGRSFLTLGRAPQGVMGREVLLQSWRGKWEIQGRAADHTPRPPMEDPPKSKQSICANNV